jgi:hypothetical protein
MANFVEGRLYKTFDARIQSPYQSTNVILDLNKGHVRPKENKPRRKT